MTNEIKSYDSHFIKSGVTETEKAEAVKTLNKLIPLIAHEQVNSVLQKLMAEFASNHTDGGALSKANEILQKIASIHKQTHLKNVKITLKVLEYIKEKATYDYLSHTSGADFNTHKKKTDLIEKQLGLQIREGNHWCLGDLEDFNSPYKIWRSWGEDGQDTSSLREFMNEGWDQDHKMTSVTTEEVISPALKTYCKNNVFHEKTTVAQDLKDWIYNLNDENITEINKYINSPRKVAGEVNAIQTLAAAKQSEDIAQETNYIFPKCLSEMINKNLEKISSNTREENAAVLKDIKVFDMLKLDGGDLINRIYTQKCIDSYTTTKTLEHDLEYLSQQLGATCIPEMINKAFQDSYDAELVLDEICAHEALVHTDL